MLRGFNILKSFRVTSLKVSAHTVL